jgi:cell division protein FtsQ
MANYSSTPALDPFGQHRFELIKRKHRKTMAKTALIVSLIVLSALVQYLVFFSPIFALDANAISITGTSKYFKIEQIENEANKWIGTPLPRLNVDKFTQSLESINGVLSAVVARNWPRGVHITIIGSTPIAYREIDQQYLLYDANANLLGTSQELIEGLTKIEIGSTQSTPIIQAVINLRNVLDDFYLERLEYIGAETNVTVTLYLTEGYQVFLGDDSQLDKKLAIARKILEQTAQKSQKIVDVSSPISPVLR